MKTSNVFTEVDGHQYYNGQDVRTMSKEDVDRAVVRQWIMDNVNPVTSTVILPDNSMKTFAIVGRDFELVYSYRTPVFLRAWMNEQYVSNYYYLWTDSSATTSKHLRYWKEYFGWNYTKLSDVEHINLF